MASDTVLEGSTVTILLQKSVVDPEKQLWRLHAIDKGWAQWGPDEDIKIFAGLDGPNPDPGHPFRTLLPLGVQATDTQPTGMTRLVRGLLALASQFGMASVPERAAL